MEPPRIITNQQQESSTVKGNNNLVSDLVIYYLKNSEVVFLVVKKTLMIIQCVYIRKNETDLSLTNRGRNKITKIKRGKNITIIVCCNANGLLKPFVKIKNAEPKMKMALHLK